jgi:hypothetical protein
MIVGRTPAFNHTSIRKTAPAAFQLEVRNNTEARALEFGLQTRLLAQFVGRNPVEGVMPLHGDGLLIVGIDRVVLAFAKQCKAVFFQVTDEIAPLDGHLYLSGDLFQQGAAHGDLFFLLAIGRYHLAQCVLEH